MINHIALENFRRHEKLELTLEQGKQIVLISGRNGAGKSTILEAITFALFGEGRHGKRNLADLVRRGAELEGFTVELEFTVGSDQYRVHRRRDGKLSTAVLYGNGVPLSEGPRQVTADIEKILGMDSAGFRLAVIAQQKDIDGLASLRPAERVAMLIRLLRLDVISAAKEKAGASFRTARDQAVALRDDTDIDLVKNSFEEAVAALTTAHEQLANAQAEVVKLNSEIADRSAVEAAWKSQREARARLEGEVQAGQREVDRASSLVAKLAVCEEPAKPEGLHGLLQQSRELEKQIAEGESQAKAAEQRGVVEGELRRIAAEISSIEDLNGKDWEGLAASTRARLDAARALQARTSQDTKAAENQAGVALWELDALKKRLEAVSKVGAVCEECGQEVSVSHREAESEKLAALIASAAASLASARSALEEAVSAEKAANAQVEQAAAAASAAAQEEVDARKARELLDGLLERQRVFEGQLARLPKEVADLDSLYALRAEIAMQTAALEERTQKWEAWRESSIRLEAESAALTAAEQSLSAAKIALDSFSQDSNLERGYDELQELKSARDSEIELERYFKEQAAVLSERVSHLQSSLERLAQTKERQERFQKEAMEYAAAARLLGDVSDQLTTLIRPSLEGAVSYLLTSMSEGRFTKVEIDADYNIRVHDDGKARDLSNLSGGETDLVALAMRLALAQVVSEQQGSGAAGFLILDECFGSQDPGRRASIMTALRNLKSSYPQVLLISHVEGMDDEADTVVEVSASDDREETYVRVA